ncbi:MAG: radical SAM family heme chaperone HemW [Clostridia bacterium]|nr:radical SAM family heme chaperone HemW [Clostridia bacterium]
MENKSGISLYVHIPFCVSKCTYCSFCSFVPHDDEMAKYLQNLIKEIELVGKKIRKSVFSIYIGGGTPSVLPLGAISQIVEMIKKCFDVLPNVSITIEANPNSINLDKAQEYYACGIRRVSIGLQSASSAVLKTLNRAHNWADFENAIKIVRSVGFEDINADIMLGVPNQSMSDVVDTLEKVIALPITHVSAYGLILEEKTPLLDKVQSGEIALPSEDETVDMYDYVVDTLSKNGFFRYEISNFAKVGFESIHNNNYWARGEFIGVGLNAYSFLDGEHYQNTNNFHAYCKKLSENHLPKEQEEKENPITAQNETIMLALRTTRGLNISKFNKKFGVDFCKKFRNTIDKLIKNDLIVLEKGFLRIKNLYISNSIIVEFFE